MVRIVHRSVRDEGGSMLREIPACRGALGGFFYAGADGLAHLERHHAAEALLLTLEQGAEPADHRGALCDRRAAPRHRRGAGASDPGLDLRAGVRGKFGERLAGGWVDRLESHVPHSTQLVCAPTRRRETPRATSPHYPPRRRTAAATTECDA